jgi:hypothetical protein
MRQRYFVAIFVVVLFAHAARGQSQSAARPGVMFIGEVTSGFDCSRSGSVTTCNPSHNNFALDAGGVLELYPSSRTIIRFDAGDTIVRIGNATSTVPVVSISSGKP